MNGIIKYLILILFLLSCEKDGGKRYTTNWYFVNKSGERIALKLYFGNTLRGNYKINTGKDCYIASSAYGSGYDIETPPGITKFILESSNGTILSDSCEYIKDAAFNWNPINNCNQKPNSLFNSNSYEKRERKLLFSKNRVFDRYFIYTGK